MTFNYSTLTGKTFANRYSLTCLISEGVIGQVFKGWDKRTRSECAIKIIDQSRNDVPHEILLRFKEEARILKSLKHNSIIEFIDFFNDDFIYGIVMKYQPFPSLASILTDKKNMSPVFVIELAKLITEGLLFIHEQGLIHYDLKPSNILIINDNEGAIELKIIDFGFSQFNIASDKKAGGTLSYMSPEQSGILQKFVDHRTDLYSLGIMMYEMLLGELPFKGDSPAVLVHQHIAKTPASLSEQKKGIPLLLEKIVLKLLSKDPDDRYHTTSGLLDDLEKYLRLIKELNTVDVNFNLATNDHWNLFPRVNPFIGRTKEMDSVLKIINNASKSFDIPDSWFEQKKSLNLELETSDYQTTVILIEGERGVGKSYFAQELFNRIKKTEGTTIFHSAKAGENNSDYETLKSIFNYWAEFFRSLHTIDQKSIIHELHKILDYRFYLLNEIIPELIPWIKEELPKANFLHKFTQEDYLEVMVELFKSSAQSNQSQAIFIDNFQFVEEGTVKLLDKIIPKLDNPSIIFVFSYLPKELKEFHKKLISSCNEKARPYRINLPALNTAEVGKLLEQIFSGKFYRLPLVLDALYQSTGGNPRIIRTILQRLIDNKYIYYENFSWNIKKKEALELIEAYYKEPDTLKPLTEWSEKELLLIRLGAVFQRSFTFESMQFCMEWLCGKKLKESFILNIIDKAIDLDVLSLDHNRFYFFTDQNLRLALLKQLPAEQRKYCHALIASYLEEFILPEYPNAIYDIAHHWDYSADYLKSIHYYIQAAKLTDKDSLPLGNPKSRIYYRLALLSLENLSADETVSPETHFEVLYKSIAHSISFTSDYETLWEELLKLEKILFNNRVNKLKFLAIKCRLAFLKEERQELEKASEELLKLRVNKEDELYTLCAYIFRPRISNDKSYPERINQLKTGISMAIEHHSFYYVPVSLAVCVEFMAHQGNFKEAEAFIENTVSKVKKLNFLQADQIRDFAMFFLEYERGNFSLVIKHANQIDSTSPLFYLVIATYFNAIKAVSLGFQGSLRNSLHLFDPIIQDIKEDKSLTPLVFAICCRIQLAISLHKYEDGLTYFEQVLDLMEEDLAYHLKAKIYMLGAHCCIELRLLEKAENYLKTSVSIATSSKCKLLELQNNFFSYKLEWLKYNKPEIIEKTNLLLREFLDINLTGYYEIYHKDLRSWNNHYSSYLSSSYTPGNNDILKLFEINQKISSSLNIQDLTNPILEGAMQIVGAQQGYLFIFPPDFSKDDKFDSINTPSYTMNSEGDLINPENYLYSKSVIKEVINSYQTVITRDARNNRKWNKNDSILINELRSIISAPIILQGKLKGIIYLENHQASGLFSLKNKEIVDVFASQVAIALNNAEIYAKEQRARQQTENTLRLFEKFVPRQFTEIIAKGEIENLNTGISRKDELSILFSDIRKFTTLSESMSSSDSFKFLNRYLKSMEVPIFKNQGFVDKYIGDAIMALFDNSPRNAVNAGIEMFQELDIYNKRRKAKGKKTLEIGVGINTGDVMIGVVGSSEKLDTTVLGDAVNIASRIESVTKLYSCPMLITENTLTRLPEEAGYFTRFVDKLIVKGKHKPVKIYEVFNYNPEEIIENKIKHHPLFMEGFFQYEEGNFLEARALFQKYNTLFPADKLVYTFIKRCDYFIKIPPADWNGIYKSDGTNPL